VLQVLPVGYIWQRRLIAAVKVNGFAGLTDPANRDNFCLMAFTISL